MNFFNLIFNWGFSSYFPLFCRKIKRKLRGSSVLQTRLKSLSSMDTAVLDEKEVICWQSDNSVRYVEIDRVTTVWCSTAPNVQNCAPELKLRLKLKQKIIKQISKRMRNATKQWHQKPNQKTESKYRNQTRSPVFKMHLKQNKKQEKLRRKWNQNDKGFNFVFKLWFLISVYNN